MLRIFNHLRVYYLVFFCLFCPQLKFLYTKFRNYPLGIEYNGYNVTDNYDNRVCPGIILSGW